MNALDTFPMSSLVALNAFSMSFTIFKINFSKFNTMNIIDYVDILHVWDFSVVDV